ncbi:MAG: hypothetical protein KGZ65_03990 [Sphingomonadales bacterium]|nr:hypothetical protein [Sphingomonadaceae bacterium]MBS3930373.1 hypothetical protein [Sphingomonadales bacterium]
MENTDEPTTALERIPVPEVVDLEIIRSSIGPSIDKALHHAAKIAASITDDASREIAIDAVEKVKDDCLTVLEKWREDYYVPKYRDAEDARSVFDTRIKEAKAVVKTIMSHVSDYNVRKKREADLARERAEAEARRLREELERKQRELEAAERRANEAAEAEKRRIKEAEEAEERRIVAEAEARIRAERAAREAAAAETARKLKEEEDARLKQAQLAKDVGNGDAKVDTILESATPISPVLAKPEQAKDLETLRLENEQATRVAEEKVLREQAAAAEAENVRLAAEADAKAKREELATATAAATSAAAAAAATSIATTTDSRTVSVTRWKVDLASDGTVDGDRAAVMTLLKAIVEGRAPIEAMGFDENHPEDFRPSWVVKQAAEKKDRFFCPGWKAYPQADEQLKRRTVGGRR